MSCILLRRLKRWRSLSPICRSHKKTWTSKKVNRCHIQQVVVQSVLLCETRWWASITRTTCCQTRLTLSTITTSLLSASTIRLSSVRKEKQLPTSQTWVIIITCNIICLPLAQMQHRIRFKEDLRRVPLLLWSTWWLKIDLRTWAEPTQMLVSRQSKAGLQTSMQLALHIKSQAILHLLLSLLLPSLNQKTSLMLTHFTAVAREDSMCSLLVMLSSVRATIRYQAAICKEHPLRTC